jgi:type I restriction enzyme S subunit
LLIVEGNGSPTEIGRMAIWSGEIGDCVHQNHIIRARMLGGVLSEYCEAYWNSPDGAARVLEVASSTSGLYTLSVSKVGRLPVPLPPLPEQRRIVAEVERRMSVIKAAEAIVEANRKRAERLRQAILQRAFQGRLVPQDPSDEPAYLLLERVKASREKLETGKIRRLGRRVGRQPEWRRVRFRA